MYAWLRLKDIFFAFAFFLYSQIFDNTHHPVIEQ